MVIAYNQFIKIRHNNSEVTKYDILIVRFSRAWIKGKKSCTRKMIAIELFSIFFGIW